MCQQTYASTWSARTLPVFCVMWLPMPVDTPSDAFGPGYEKDLGEGLKRHREVARHARAQLQSCVERKSFSSRVHTCRGLHLYEFQIKIVPTAVFIGLCHDAGVHWKSGRVGQLPIFAITNPDRGGYSCEGFFALMRAHGNAVA